jgi:large subunit ribosomal protein L23
MALKVFKKQEEKKEKKNEKQSFCFGVLKNPCITEKSSMLNGKNFYVFKINKDSNKKQVKEAIENQYKVNVEKITIVNIPKKRKFQGRKISGFKSGYKKAIVKIKEGEKIEIIGK